LLLLKPVLLWENNHIFIVSPWKKDKGIVPVQTASNQLLNLEEMFNEI